MISGFITLLIVLLALAIYLYCQNIHLTKNLNKKLETENRKESFLATLIHDLKTPTNAQINTLNLLKNETFGKLNSQQQEMISLTQESCKYVSSLIGTIMETYNCESGTIKLNKSNFNLVELIISLCEETKNLHYEHNQIIMFNNKLKNSTIYADELQIKRVILNLLSNAITYSYKNTNIEIVLTDSNNHIEVYVKNQSKQIPEKELSTIFDKYQKTEYAHFNKTSNGLGLYLSKKIIELHNGEIYAKSEQDGTCIFGFTLPIYQEEKSLKTAIQKI